MNTEHFLVWAGLTSVAVLVTYLVVRIRTRIRLGKYKTLSEALLQTSEELSTMTKRLADAKSQHELIDRETKDLQELKGNADQLGQQVEQSKAILADLMGQAHAAEITSKEKAEQLHELLAKLDLYTRIEELSDCAHFEMPDYLHETSARFTEEIKRVREKQKEIIRAKKAVICPSSISVHPDKAQNKRILDGQIRLMLTAFNVECDLLIGKIKPSTYPRTLERIANLANTLEKSAATLRCGFNLEYVKLKCEECRLQYQFSLKKQEEQEEQRLIREQIREEQRAIKEYERALAEAEREEQMYGDMLKRAREELLLSSEEDRLMAEQKIADLEQRLREAEAKEERAKSMAEQTRKGHVYVISNIGSFGDSVYKIGLTRRLDPLDRVKELGDASVPFSFDVHAIIYAEDAPTLETALHREFSSKRVNAVNLRKEFFRTELADIKRAVERVAGVEADFKMTALAEEYNETRRLMAGSQNVQQKAS